MTAPGNIDEAGWRVPKKPLSMRIYYLAKADYKATKIAELVGSTPGSVRVLLYQIKRPRKTVFGWRWKDDPKTPRKLGNRKRARITKPKLSKKKPPTMWTAMWQLGGN